MKIIHSVKELENEIFIQKKNNATIGFVPTMGALHKGHLSLIEQAQKNCDTVIVSIFINPTQFTSPEDFEKYPQTLDADIQKLEKEGIDIAFIPEQNDIYAEGKFLWKDDIHLPEIFSQAEGAARPGHFEGVYQVLHRLFSLVQPDKVFFGQKDFQQTLLVYVLIYQEFGNEIELFRCPIIREASGLAMSSRNRRFSPEEKEKHQYSPKVYSPQKNYVKGVQSTEILEMNIRKILESEPLVTTIHSIEFRNIHSFQTVERADEKTIILLSCEFAGIHLIDNSILGE